MRGFYEQGASKTTHCQVSRSLARGVCLAGSQAVTATPYDNISSVTSDKNSGINGCYCCYNNLSIVNLDTSQNVPTETVSDGITAEITQSSYTAILTVVSGEGIGLIAVDLMK